VEAEERIAHNEKNKLATLGEGFAGAAKTQQKRLHTEKGN